MTSPSPAGPARAGAHPGRRAAVARRGAWLLLCALSLALAPAPAGAQGGQGRDEEDRQRQPGPDAVGFMPAYCSVVEVEKTQLSNATIVTVKANGLLKTLADSRDFLVEDEPGEYEAKETTRFPIRIENARSQIGSFVDINLYPISHLEITIPPDAKEGIGLVLTTVLFTAGYARQVNLTDSEFSGYFGGGSSSSRPEIPVEILMSENQRDIIIIATSDRHIDLERQQEAEAVRQRKAMLGMSYENGSLYVHAVNVTAAQLLDEIGNQTGTKISLAEPSPAVASMHLDGMALPDALQSIARAYGLGVANLDGGFVLAPGWPAGGAPYSFSSQRSFPIRYLRAEEAADLLPNVLDRYTHVDRDHNAIVATGSPALLDKVGADLAVIDKPPPMIEAEAIVVDAARNYDLAKELDLQFVDGTTSLTSAPGAGDITFRVLSDPPQRFRAALSALEARGIVKTRAKAHVTAWNGEYARVFGGVVQYFPFRTTRRGRQEVTLESADVGVRLSGYFYTGGQGSILSSIYFRANNVASVNPQGLPFVASRYVRTNVQLTDGDTIYMGGISLRQTETRRHKVPVLGDLPLLGRLFRARRHSVNERSVAAFLTVRIADDAAVAAHQRATADAPTAPVAQWSDASDALSESEGSLDG